MLRHNITFRYILAFILLGAFLILEIEPVRRWLGFAALDWLEIGVAAGTGVALLVVFEVMKAFGVERSAGDGAYAASPST